MYLHITELTPIPPRDFEPHAQRAADKAGPEWQERATELFLRVLSGSERPLLCEQVAATAYAMGLDHPPTPQSWGSITTKLRKAGKIVWVDYAPAHDKSPKSLWRAA